MLDEFSINPNRTVGGAIRRTAGESGRRILESSSEGCGMIVYVSGKLSIHGLGIADQDGLNRLVSEVRQAISAKLDVDLEGDVDFEIEETAGEFEDA